MMSVQTKWWISVGWLGIAQASCAVDLSEGKNDLETQVSHCSEPVPNDSAETATPYVLGVPAKGCIGDTGDVDYYEVVAPDDNPAGGYFLASFTDVGDGGLDTDIYADKTHLANVYKADRGVSVDEYWAASAGSKYRVAAHSFIGSDFGYTLTITYHPIDDSDEPDDTRDQAQPIALGTSAHAYYFAGYSDSDADRRQRFDDWYSFEADKGTLSVALEDVPTDVQPDLYLYDPNGAAVGSDQYSTTGGASVKFTKTLAMAGTYRLQLGTFEPVSGVGESKRSGDVPESFSRPYTLTITQP